MSPNYCTLHNRIPDHCPGNETNAQNAILYVLYAIYCRRKWTSDVTVPHTENEKLSKKVVRTRTGPTAIPTTIFHIEKLLLKKDRSDLLHVQEVCCKLALNRSSYVSINRR